MSRLKRKFLVIFEAAGIQKGDGRTFLRTLLSEGRVRYVTNVQTKDGWEPKEFELEGPTGLLMTTTATGLHPEDESRMLSITVDDSPDQIRRVLLKMADEVVSDADLYPWHSFHNWLEQGPQDVTVPFELTLASLIKPVHNRIKRDFGHFQTLIRAHALIHQGSRKTDADGRIVAELKDYEAVRDLVADIVSTAVEASVTPELRQTVEAVERLSDKGRGSEARTFDSSDHPGGVPLWAVAEVLGIDKSAASRRVHDAIRRGYLVNHETRKGKPLRIALGNPLPEDQDVFPTIEQLKAAVTGQAA